MTPQQALASYRRAMRNGETILIRRYVGSGPDQSTQEASVRARPLASQGVALVGDVEQARRKLVVINDPAAAVPAGKVSLASLLPLVANSDCAVVGGKEMRIADPVDDWTRRIGGQVIALEIEVVG